jgi:4-aminobutyrate aminotransferase-like enzyme
MTDTLTTVTPRGTDRHAAARDHLWGHFTRQSAWAGQVPTIVRGEGHHIWDDRGRKYIDGLAGLFVVQAGHGRAELAGRVSRPPSSGSSRCGPTRTRRRSTSRSGSRTTRPAT